jgi:hypothetical protein
MLCPPPPPQQQHPPSRPPPHPRHTHPPTLHTATSTATAPRRSRSIPRRWRVQSSCRCVGAGRGCVWWQLAALDAPVSASLRPSATPTTAAVATAAECHPPHTRRCRIVIVTRQTPAQSHPGLRQLPCHIRYFSYMPLMHSEALEDQEVRDWVAWPGCVRQTWVSRCITHSSWCRCAAQWQLSRAPNTAQHPQAQRASGCGGW